MSVLLTILVSRQGHGVDTEAGGGFPVKLQIPR
jgi:hypothetical protein